MGSVIESHRREINRLDDVIMEAVEKRQRVVAEIQAFKAQNDIQPRDEDREQEILSKIEEKSEVAEDELKGVYKALFGAASDKHES